MHPDPLRVDAPGSGASYRDVELLRMAERCGARRVGCRDIGASRWSGRNPQRLGRRTVDRRMPTRHPPCAGNVVA